MSDIATASILQSVLLHFFRLGGVLLSTSNRLPSDLYGGGVQKKRIESFLECLKGRCEVLELDGGRDWRAREGGAEGEEGGRWEVDDGFEGRKRWTSKWIEVTHGEEGAFLFERWSSWENFILTDCRLRSLRPLSSTTSNDRHLQSTLGNRSTDRRRRGSSVLSSSPLHLCRPM